MKKIFAIILTATLSLSLFAQSKTKLSVGLLNGPSAIPTAYLIENKSNFKQAELDFQIFQGADLELPKLIKDELDIGVLPPNVAAKVYNMTKGNVLALAIIGNSNISLLTTKDDYKDLFSLANKTVYCAGRGATPEYMFKYILGHEKNRLLNQVTLDFSIPNAELASSLISGKVDYILVPEPFATVAQVKSKKVKKVMELSKEFKSLQNNEDFPITLLVVNKNSLIDKKDEIASFLKSYEQSLNWTVKNPMLAGKLVEKNTLGLNAQIATKSIPNGNYVFVTAEEGKVQIEKLLNIFLEQNSQSIGDKLPDENFYQK